MMPLLASLKAPLCLSALLAASSSMAVAGSATFNMATSATKGYQLCWVSDCSDSSKVSFEGQSKPNAMGFSSKVSTWINKSGSGDSGGATWITLGGMNDNLVCTVSDWTMSFKVQLGLRAIGSDGAVGSDTMVLTLSGSMGDTKAKLQLAPKTGAAFAAISSDGKTIQMK